mmetsp:Transcript_34628/g.58771  ORF Transcript_34628/g.58771 Transcript_34628/m.58771 type:complete len:121 (+) Transcript_34628:2-364(+)
MKIRKNGSTYVDWLDTDDDEKKKNQLAASTKCVWTRDLKRMIQECWDGNLWSRPSMKNVEERLEGCIQELTEQHQRPKDRKTTKVHCISASGASETKIARQGRDLVRSRGDSDCARIVSQ